jgi:hypothetical protein
MFRKKIIFDIRNCDILRNSFPAETSFFLAKVHTEVWLANHITTGKLVFASALANQITITIPSLDWWNNNIFLVHHSNSLGQVWKRKR